MPKKIVPTPDPTPAPVRVTVGEKILARMDELFDQTNGVLQRLVNMEAQIWTITHSIEEVSEQLSAFDTVLAKMQEDIDSTRYSADAAESAAENAGREVENLASAMPDVTEIVDTLRRQESTEWLASLKPAF